VATRKKTTDDDHDAETGPGPDAESQSLRTAPAQNTGDPTQEEVVLSGHWEYQGKSYLPGDRITVHRDLAAQLRWSGYAAAPIPENADADADDEDGRPVKAETSAKAEKAEPAPAETSGSEGTKAE
jgi:hypothetical protein